jgi:hypothetical protein
MIHPGSVMFKRSGDSPSPQFIVAGEIVRTTRMYAMSVSPLHLETLKQISPLLLFELGGIRDTPEREGRKKRAERKQRRDFTNSIKLGACLFPIETIKGKKNVAMDWEKLKDIKDNFDEFYFDRDQYRGLRGVITYKNHTLLAGEKLSLILSLLPILELEGSLEREWKRKKNFFSGEEDSLKRLSGELPNVLLPAQSGKKAKRGKTPPPGNTDWPGRELGFISLFTDYNGGYWFRCSRGFHTALSESIASLEALIDELEDHVPVEIKHEVNQTYRRLADILNG